MSHVLLINEDNTISTTRRARIMQRSKNVDNLWILVSPTYKGIDLTNATVMMEYVKPVSRRYKTEILVLSDEMYEDHLKYVLPFDTELTDEAGSIEIQITFTMVDLDANGNGVQYVRKTSKNVIPVVPITAWSDIVPDEALSSLDQRLLKLDAQTKGLEAYAEFLSQNQVDGLAYNDETETLQLTSNGYGVGDPVNVRDFVDDGIPVVEFGNGDSESDPDSDSNTDHGEGCGCGCEDNVVEFGYDDTGNSGSGTTTPEEDDESNVVEF